MHFFDSRLHMIYSAAVMRSTIRFHIRTVSFAQRASILHKTHGSMNECMGVSPSARSPAPFVIVQWSTFLVAQPSEVRHLLCQSLPVSLSVTLGTICLNMLCPTR